MRRLSLTARLFVVYTLFVALAGWYVLRLVLQEVKPAVRQSTEETLVDTANLLAEIVRDDLVAGRLVEGDLARVLQSYGSRRPGAQIWGINKNDVTHRIYVTDARGIVLLDSAGIDVGADYSRWNDVYLTLRGEYGARSTQAVPGDEGSTVMYVAAPVRDGDRIAGVVTVAKPNRSVQPFIARAERRLVYLAALLVAMGLIMGAAASWWLSRTIRRLTHYADAVTAGERAALPQLPGGELNQLAQALETMRDRLEGKAYVEQYVQTLTHELKGPLAGIRGASELLHQDLPRERRDRFLDNIDAETVRMQSLIERLLHLAQVEQRRGLEGPEPLQLAPLVNELLEDIAPRLARAQVRASASVPAGLAVLGERFLVRQALANLIDNAMDFTPPGGCLRIDAALEPGVRAPLIAIRVVNEGQPIPEYALPRVMERFYSLPRPATGRKSTGLGLSFVREVAQLHGGRFEIANGEGGVQATLWLPESAAHPIPT
ncbi:MAG: two-component system sensor histidine kinase CreC [Nevskiaceae bacterium]|jgi:two-component system sensor histidine kinase CreC|nr:two-component system sensor histidine kinase CreC [Nevskiaceae bacterium]